MGYPCLSHRHLLNPDGVIQIPADIFQYSAGANYDIWLANDGKGRQTHTHAAVSKTHTRTFAQDLQLTDGPISSVLQSFMMICYASTVKEEVSAGKKCDICKASLSVSLSWRKFGLHQSVEHIRWCTRTARLNNPQSIKEKKKANGVLSSCEKKKKKNNDNMTDVKRKTGEVHAALTAVSQDSYQQPTIGAFTMHT